MTLKLFVGSLIAAAFGGGASGGSAFGSN